MYDKFLSAGFADINAKSRRHVIELYRHNYCRFLPENKSAKILDIGCGMGHFLEFLGEEGYENILGVDISRECVGYCLERGIAKVKLIENLLEFLPGAGVFDFVVMNDVVEHMTKEEIVSALALIKERLNSAGKIIIKTGNMASLAGLRIRYNDFTHQLGFTEYSLTQVLKISGFKDIMICPYVFPVNRFTRAARFCGQKILHGVWKAAHFFEFTNPPRLVDELIFAVGRIENRK